MWQLKRISTLAMLPISLLMLGIPCPFVLGARNGPDHSLEFAFTIRDDRLGQVTRHYRGAKAVAILDGSYRVVQWVPRWKAFALTNGENRVYKWDGAEEVAAVIDLRRLNLVDPIRAFSVCPRANRIAVLQEESLIVADVRTGKVVSSVGTAEIRRQTGRSLTGVPWSSSVAWSPDGSRIAASFPDGKDYRNSDGSRLTITVVFALSTKRVAIIGVGSPVAWMSDREVLCREDRFSDSRFRVIVHRPGGSSRRSQSWHSDVSWDGNNVIYADKGRVMVVRPDLRTLIQTITVPEFNPRDVVSPDLVSIICVPQQTQP